MSTPQNFPAIDIIYKENEDIMNIFDSRLDVFSDKSSNLNNHVDEINSVEKNLLTKSSQIIESIKELRHAVKEKMNE